MSWPVMTYCLPSMTKRLVEPCRCISTVMGALFPFAFYWNLSAPLACAFSAWWIHYSPFYFFFLSQVRAFPKNQVTVSVFCPLYEVFFFSLTRQMSENVALTYLFQTAFQYKFGSMYIRQQTIMTLGLFIYLCGRENMQLSNILQLMISGKYIFKFRGKESVQFIFPSKQMTPHK